ncbi:RNA polymerase subunit sigma-24 [Segatella asaccharophila]
MVLADNITEISLTVKTAKSTTGTMSKKVETKKPGKLIEENQSKLKSFITKRVPNKEDAEDILQDVLYQFLKTVKETDNPISQVTAWLYHVARNQIINKRKKKHEAEMPVVSDDEDDEDVIRDFSEMLFDSDPQTPETEYLKSLVWQELDTALSSLPTEQRRAFELTEMEGLSVKEAARLENISINTLLSRKHYAVIRLRDQLEDLYHDIICF